MNPTTALRYEAFAREYATNGFNATQAALTVGYSPRTARRQASDLLTNTHIQALISRFTQPVLDKYEITIDKTLRVMARRSYGTLKDVGTWDADGFHVFPSDEMDEDQAGMLKSLTTTVTQSFDPKTGAEVSRKTRTQVELYDDLDLLAAYQGLKPTSGKIRINVDARKQTANVFELAGLTKEEILEIARMPLSTEVAQ